MAGKKPKEETELFNVYLRQNGLKKTYQKDLILDTFLNTEGHLSVEDIYARVKQRDKKIGVVTVFRTLKSLAACGIAREVSLGDGLTRFEHSYHHPHHHHLICVECGKTIEFISPGLEILQDEILKEYSFQPLQHRFKISGICMDCRERRPVSECPSIDTEKIFARDALKMVVTMETKSGNFYKRAAEQNQDASGREMLEKIVKEKETHLASLNAAYDELILQEKGLEAAPLFLHINPDTMERLIPDLQQLKTENQFRLNGKESLDLAIKLERKTSEYFKELANKFMDTQGKIIFKRFAEEEVRHCERIGIR